MNELEEGYIQDLSTHLSIAKDSGVGIKSGTLEFAALRQGYPVRRLSRRRLIITIRNREWPFVDILGMGQSFAGKGFCDEKAVARELLRSSGLPVAVSRQYSGRIADLESGSSQ